LAAQLAGERQRHLRLIIYRNDPKVYRNDHKAIVTFALNLAPLAVKKIID
jgi:hypothetical protein